MHPGRVWGGGGVLPQKLGRGVRPASQNPYPIYDQNLRFSLPYLWPHQNFGILSLSWLLEHYPQFETRLVIISPVQTNVKDNIYLLLLGRL